MKILTDRFIFTYSERPQQIHRTARRSWFFQRMLITVNKKSSLVCEIGTSYTYIIRYVDIVKYLFITTVQEIIYDLLNVVQKSTIKINVMKLEIIVNKKLINPSVLTRIPYFYRRILSSDYRFIYGIENRLILVRIDR